MSKNELPEFPEGGSILLACQSLEFPQFPEGGQIGDTFDMPRGLTGLV